MNTVSGTMLGLALAMGSLACSAQDAKIPIKQLEREAQLSARTSVPANEAAIGRASEAYSGSSSSGFVFVPPAPKPPRTLSKGFLVLNGLHLGMAIFDVEMTQHCIADQHCVEGNPIMPSSHAGQLGVNFALVSYSTFMSYRLKKKESKLWILAPTAGIVAHTVGVVSGFAHY
ncbi:MAG TPA: hypothetical protein VMW15_12275 [Terracidiphilus sp.]|nr:hypothetical protein [Terracidiphilus sp.]